MRYTPENITSLGPNEIFVFGSNLAGIHGAGAAYSAMKDFGAEMRRGVGRTGQCYALPTKNERLETLSLRAIQGFVDEFVLYAAGLPKLTFLVTAVGCGLAGYFPRDIAPMFLQGPRPLPDNAVLPKSFWATLD